MDRLLIHVECQVHGGDGQRECADLARVDRRAYRDRAGAIALVQPETARVVLAPVIGSDVGALIKGGSVGRRAEDDMRLRDRPSALQVRSHISATRLERNRKRPCFDNRQITSFL